MAEPPLTRYDAGLEKLQELLGDLPAYRARQVWKGLYQRMVDPQDMTDLPAALRNRLHESLPPALAEVHRSTSDGGDTVKTLWRLSGGATVESVLMHQRGPRSQWSTVCVSTQAGCAMGCGFCATGQVGLERNLTVGEIVEQVVRAAQEAQPRRLSNVVFMGMGEPLANYRRTWAATERIHDHIGISARKVTISTVGIVPGIERLARERLPVTLAVSLHAANDRLRDELVPVNQRYPLSDLIAACQRWIDAHGRRLSLEWALIDGVNDRDTDAEELAAIARSLRAHVNLIPLNPTPGYPVLGSSPDRVRAFRDLLRSRGTNATVRRTRGTDIDAACGQLHASRDTLVAAPRTRSGPTGKAQ